MSAQVTLELEVTLPDEERTERAKEAVRLTDELDKMDEEFKDSRADWRRRIKEIKTKRDLANKAFMIGCEIQKLLCVEHINFDTKKAEYIHQGTVLKSRDLTMAEIANLESIPLFDNLEESPASDMKEVIQAETGKRSKKDLVSH